MINLFDTYDVQTRDLHRSLLKAGYTHPTVVIEDTGFLPENVVSPYSYYIYKGVDKISGRAKYFNQVPIPEYWEIHATNQLAEVFNYVDKKAVIEYIDPKHKRLVKSVSWLGTNGVIRSKDLYNQYGWRYGQVMYNLEGSPITTTYYTFDNREVIVENHVTNDIILNEADKVYIFKTKQDFVTHFFECNGIRFKSYSL